MEHRKFMSLYLCLKAGNDVDLMPRTKGGKKIRIMKVSRRFEHKDSDKGIKVVATSDTGAEITLIAGDVLKQPAKYGYAWNL